MERRFVSPGPEFIPGEYDGLLKELKLSGISIHWLYEPGTNWLMISEGGRRLVWKRNRSPQLVHYVDKYTKQFSHKEFTSTEEAIAFIKELLCGT